MRLLKILAIGRPLLDARFVLQCALGSLILISEIGNECLAQRKIVRLVVGTFAPLTL